MRVVTIRLGNHNKDQASCSMDLHYKTDSAECVAIRFEFSSSLCTRFSWMYTSIPACMLVVLAVIALGQSDFSGFKERTCGVHLVQRVREICHTVNEETCKGMTSSGLLQQSLRSIGEENTRRIVVFTDFSTKLGIKKSGRLCCTILTTTIDRRLFRCLKELLGAICLLSGMFKRLLCCSLPQLVAEISCSVF